RQVVVLLPALLGIEEAKLRQGRMVVFGESLTPPPELAEHALGVFLEPLVQPAAQQHLLGQRAQPPVRQHARRQFAVDGLLAAGRHTDRGGAAGREQERREGDREDPHVFGCHTATPVRFVAMTIDDEVKKGSMKKLLLLLLLAAYVGGSTAPILSLLG